MQPYEGVTKQELERKARIATVKELQLWLYDSRQEVVRVATKELNRRRKGRP